MKRKIIIFSSLACVLTLVGCLIYALIIDPVIDKKKIVTSSDLVSLSSGSYYEENVTSGDELTLAFSKDTITYDIIFYSENWNEISNLQVNGNDVEGHYLTNQAGDSFTVEYDSSNSRKIHVAVVPYDTHNKYVSTLFELSLLNVEYRHLISTANDLKVEENGSLSYTDYYQNIYFLDDITIHQATTINIPGKYNLLWSNIILNANLTIEHHYGGVNTFTTISGTIVNNLSKQFNLYTYNGYFDVDDSISVTNKIEYGNDSIDYLSMAKRFIENYLPYYIENDEKIFYLSNKMELPAKYHGYDISYSYLISDDGISYQRFTGSFDRSENNVEKYLKIETTEGNETKVSEFKIKFLGTSSDAMNVYLQGLFFEMISITELMVGEDIEYLNNSLDLYTLLTQFYKETISNLAVSYNTNLTNENPFNSTYKIHLELSDSNLFTKIKYSTSDSLEYKSVSSIDINFKVENNLIKLYVYDSTEYKKATSLVLKVSDFCYMDSNETITMSMGESTNSLSAILKVKGITEEERNTLLKRYIKDLYITKQENIYMPFLDSVENKITKNSNVLFESTLGVSSIEYYGYISSKEAYLALKESVEENKYSDYISSHDTSSMLVFENGYLAINPNIEYDSMNRLFYIAKVEYASGNVYYSLNEIIIPASGIGTDSDNTQYSKGDTFQSFFSNHPYLVSSTSKDEFDSNNSQIQINAKFISQNGTEIAAQKIYDTTKAQTESNWIAKITPYNNGFRVAYGIEVNIQNAPKTNTYVTVEFEFVLRESPTTIISVQEYSFIIPGVYRYGTDFTSLETYIMALEQYGCYSGYLPVNNASNTIDIFSMNSSSLQEIFAREETDAKLSDERTKYFKELGAISDGYVVSIPYLIECGILDSSMDVSDSISLKGIEYLEYQRIRIDGENQFTISNINSLMTNKSITEIQLKNLGLTDETFTDSINFKGFLSLKKVDLSYNALTKVKENSFYRAVTYLDVSHNQITTIDYLSDMLPNLIELNVNSNRIESFQELKKLKNLYTVYVYGNATSIDGLYGTHGKANASIYGAIYDRVNLYITEDHTFTVVEDTTGIHFTLENGYAINNTEYDGILIINSMMIKGEYTTDTLVMPEYIYQTSYNNQTKYMVTYVASSKGSISGTTITVSEAGDFKVLFKITYNGIEIYREITITKK